jgi:hypothetical protein
MTACREPGRCWDDLHHAAARTRRAWTGHAAAHPDLTADEGLDYALVTMLELLDGAR